VLTKTVISGFGGQGVLFMGSLLATVAMEQDYHTTYLPSYGAEVRGGTANCTVAISDEPIASPMASKPDFVVAMNNPSLIKFQAGLVTGGSLFINADLVDVEPHRDDIEIFRVPAVSLANEIGNPKGMNVVMVGAFLKQTDLLEYGCMERVIQETFTKKSEKLVQPNLLALRAGFEWNGS
jgi:2-oxoglutarate ferredoxin oxidoreductase subunit gamma